MIKCLYSHSHDPYFNLAVEEYLLKNATESFYFQYLNDDSVVIGKHQNTLAEIDQQYLDLNNIKLARRVSGGGAVYHDKGNLNYSFITSESPGDYIRFKTYTSPIISALKKLGVPASLGTRNEILAGDKKVSGTASHVFKNRVLHHGTLLFDTDLKKLSHCLYVDTSRYKDRGVKSIRSEVVNLKSMLGEPMDMYHFSRYILQHVTDEMTGSITNLSAEDEEAINSLREEKFVTWEWNYGYSPDYEFERSIDEIDDTLSIKVRVKKGVISDIIFSGESNLDEEQIRKALTGIFHEPVKVSRALSALFSDQQLVEIFFRVLF